jgi:excisionase family DNA binding protein
MIFIDKGQDCPPYDRHTKSRPRGRKRLGGEMAPKDDALLTPAEVAALFRVDPKTVTRWAKAGKLSSIRTLGGHRRYRADEVRKFLEGAKQSGEMSYVGI